MYNNSKLSLFKNLKDDILASIIVFLAAVPLCLGIALALGIPLLAGLISGVIGGIVVGRLNRNIDVQTITIYKNKQKMPIQYLKLTNGDKVK